MTPIARAEVPAGRHTVVCRHPEFGEASTRLEVSPGDEVRHRFRLLGDVRFRVRPWARVIVDGDELGVTPMAAQSLPAGTREVVLVNEDLDVRRRLQVEVVAGESRTVEADLTE